MDTDWRPGHDQRFILVDVNLLFSVFRQIDGEFRSVPLFQAIKPTKTPTEGIEADRQCVPGLFDLIDSVNNALPRVPIDKVWITNSFGARAVTILNWSFWKKHQNEIQLGIFLFFGLSHQQLKSIIAHEIAHLPITRLQNSWPVFVAPLTIDKIINNRFYAPIRPLMQILSDRFTALEYVVGQKAEQACDRFAASIWGVQATCLALGRGHALMRWSASDVELEDQPGFFSRTTVPPGDWMQQKLAIWQAKFSDPIALESWRQKSLTEISSCFSTHEDLAQRVKSIESEAKSAKFESAQLNRNIELQTAAGLLSNPDSVLDQVSQAVVRFHLNDWKKRLRWLEHLRQITDVGQPPKDARGAWDRFIVASTEHSFDAGKKWLQRVIELDPNDDQAKYKLVSRTLSSCLENPNVRQARSAEKTLIRLLDSASTKTADRAFHALLGYYQLVGCATRLRCLEQYFDSIQRRLRSVRSALQTIGGRYTGLQPDGRRLETLRSIFARHSKITRVTVAKKIIPECSATIFAVLVVKFRPLSFFSRDRFQINAKITKLVDEIEQESMFDRFYVFADTGFSPWLRKFKNVQGCEIYRSAAADDGR